MKAPQRVWCSNPKNQNIVETKNTFPTHYIVLKDKYGQLIDWNGYKSKQDALVDFMQVYGYYQTCSDGGFTMNGYQQFADEDGNTIALLPASADLLQHILLDSLPLVADMFAHFFQEKRKK